METSEKSLNYTRIEKAIAFILDHQVRQPDLDAVAQHVHLSPYHFQRLFQEWVGTSPKKFMQYISLAHAKTILKDNQSILSTSHIIGLSSSSRLHDLFVNIEAMTPAEYKNGGEYLSINYSIQDTPFGHIVIASTSKGICQISFIDSIETALDSLKAQFPKAQFQAKEEDIHQDILSVFNVSSIQRKPINVHIKGTDFQLKVWEALLSIPFGKLQTYRHIANAIHKPAASRAVGTAIGSNPLAYLIPCHRVIQASGVIGGYMWNPIRKTAIIGWESSQSNSETDETI